MEELPIRAIIIGVSVFVTMAVLSAILLYFNTAREIANRISLRTDIAETYDSIMNQEMFEDYLTGVQVRSLICKYVGDSNVTINIIEIGGGEPANYNKNISYSNINNSNEWVITSNGTKIIRESKLDVVNPTWNCKVEKVQNREKTTLNIRLNVEK